MGMIYLVRHGEPQFSNGYSVSQDPEGPRYYGSLDLELSPLGKQHAAALQKPLEALGETELLSSPMLRARHTMERIFPGKTYDTEENFREIDLGEWEGRSFQDVREHEEENFEERWNNLEHFRSPGGESFKDLRKRVVPAFKALAAKERHKPLVITAHGGVFLVILQELLGVPLQTVFSLRQDYCGVHVLETSRGGSKITLRQLNWHPAILGTHNAPPGPPRK